MAVSKAMVGMIVSVYANQADRDGVVLCAVDNRALVEYVMPEGRTFLRICPMDEYGYIDSEAGSSVSYKAIPKKFVDAMRADFSRVLGILKGGFDADEVAGKRHPLRHRRERLASEALANRCRILCLPIGDAAERRNALIIDCGYAAYAAEEGHNGEEA